MMILLDYDENFYDFSVQWTSDSVGKRELAGKMAKLNAVELAKFSKRVCGEFIESFDL